MKRQLLLRCLGHPALFLPSGRIVQFRSRKHLALLVYLAVDARRSHRRDDLLDFFWPNVKLPKARQSLSTALSFLRAHLGNDVLTTTRDHITLKSGILARDIDQLTTSTIAPDAVTDFLDGFDIPDTPAFSLWKDGQRAQWRPIIKQALTAAIDHQKARGNYRQIEDIANRILAIDDLSEEAIHAKMEARALAGDRLTSLRVYEEWKAKLADELQAMPSRSVENIARQLRNRAPSASAKVRHDTGANAAPRHLFIGRTEEHRILHDAWRLAGQSQSSNILLTGDSGIGKTTLAEHFAASVEIGGGVVIRVRCYDIEQAIPYSVISELAAALVARPGALAASEASLAELVRFFPKLQPQFPQIRPSVVHHGEAAYIRLTEAFLELLHAVVDEQAVLTIIDDVHLIDDASLAILHLTLRRSRGRAWMALLVARHSDGQYIPLTERLRDNGADWSLREIELGPLSDYESQTLLRALIPEDRTWPDAVTERILIQAAAGYPMVLEFLAQDWQISGDRSLALAIDAMTESVQGSDFSRGAYRKILQKVTTTLSPTAKAALQAASVLGNRLNDIAAYEFVGLSAEQATGALLELVGRRVLRDNGQHLEFVNEIIRGAAYLATPSLVRRTMHSQIADKLFQADRDAGELGLEIAWHCIRSGRLAEAELPLVCGSHQALQRGAPHSAERALASALPSLTGISKTKASLLLIEALQEQSRWHDSIALLQDLRLDGQTTDADLSYLLLVRAQRMTGYYKAHHLPAVLAQLTTFIASSHDGHTQTRAAVEAASIHNVLRLPSSSFPHLWHALDAVQEHALDTADKSLLLLARAMLLYGQRLFDQSLQCIQAGLRMFQSAQTVNSTLSMLHCGMGFIHALRGRYAEALASHLKGGEIAHRIGNERVHALAAANAALAHLRLGSYGAAVTYAEQALAYPKELQTIAAQAYILASAMLNRGDVVERAMRQHTHRIHTTNPAGIGQAWELYCSDALLLLGRDRDAEATAARALGASHDGQLLEICTGPYARWTGKLGAHTPDAAQKVEHLLILVGRLADFDALDQLEVLTAVAELESHLGIVDRGRLAEISGRARALPPGVTDQLERLRR